MLTDTRPVATTVERVIHHIYMMYPSLNRQEISRLVMKAIVSEKSSFINDFNDPVFLRYTESTWLTLSDPTLYIERRFCLPLALADIYLYGTLDRFEFFDPTPYRIDEKNLHRCRRYVARTQEELLNDIETYFGVTPEEINQVLSDLMYVKKAARIENERCQIDFVVDDLSYPSIGVTRLNYGHLSNGDPRKKFTHYDLRLVIAFMGHLRLP